MDQVLGLNEDNLESISEIGGPMDSAIMAREVLLRDDPKHEFGTRTCHEHEAMTMLLEDIVDPKGYQVL